MLSSVFILLTQQAKRQGVGVFSATPDWTLLTWMPLSEHDNILVQCIISLLCVNLRVVRGIFTPIGGRISNGSM